MANFVGKFSSSEGGNSKGNQRSGGGKSSKQSDSRWNMWKPTGTEYNDAGTDFYEIECSKSLEHACEILAKFLRRR